MHFLKLNNLSNSIASLLLLLALLTLVPNPSFSPIDSPSTESNLNESGERIFPGLPNTSDGLSELEQKEEQAQNEKALLQQQQNWSTYEDPLLGIQFEYPSWWEKTQREDLVKFYLLPDRDDLMYYEIFANVHYFLPPLPAEMNTLDKFMRQMMNELRSSFTQNISVNKTSTIGVDDIPAYKVEYDDVLSSDLHMKNIRYFSIDNSTGTGYMISLHTNMEQQWDQPNFFVV